MQITTINDTWKVSFIWMPTSDTGRDSYMPTIDYENITYFCATTFKAYDAFASSRSIHIIADSICFSHGETCYRNVHFRSDLRGRMYVHPGAKRGCNLLTDWVICWLILASSKRMVQYNEASWVQENVLTGVRIHSRGTPNKNRLPLSSQPISSRDQGLTTLLNSR